MNNKKLKIYFADFWPNFKFDDNYFFNLLSTRYILDITSENPDLLIHSVDYSGSSEFQNFKNKNTKKIFFLLGRTQNQIITKQTILFHFRNMKKIEIIDYRFGFYISIGLTQKKINKGILHF